ncbi:MAG: hypothetical protein H0X33_14845 [Taibaiella sp.]|nr:hypothetical protein [Taibaiella sp.]
MIKHVTYTNDLMTISADRCRQSALRFGADESEIVRREDISTDSYPYNLGHVCDYWAWKSRIIVKEMNSLGEGDFLVYSDAGIEFLDDIRHVVCEMTDDFMFFSNGWKHSEWCKMDVFKAVGVEPGEEKQVQASLIFFRKSKKSVDFVIEWMNLCHTPNLIDDSPSIATNVPTFAAARHDQSIIATLAVKYGIPLHWYPVTTAYHIKGDYPNDLYPCIALHHRKRNNEW